MELKSLFILLLCFFGKASSQSKELIIRNIDNYVHSIESDKKVATYKFEIKGKWNLIQYEYKKKENKIVAIRRTWNEKNRAYVDHYTDYFISKNDKRVYGTQSITSTNKSDSEDISGWSCQFWFQNNQVVHMMSHGHGKTESDDWDYEKEMKENYDYMMKTVKTFDKKLQAKARK